MRSPALKLFFVLLTLGVLFCSASIEARTPFSIRLIGGLSQAGAYKVDGDLSDPTLLLGLGARCQITNRHSVFLDIERIELSHRSETNYQAFLTDFELSREPLTEVNSSLSPYWPITLGYQFDILDGAVNRISPHLSIGVSMLRNSVTSGYYMYPNLDVSSNEEIERDSKVTQTDFGISLGLGCSARVSSFLSISLDGRFRDLGVPARSFQTSGRPDTQQNMSGLVFQGTDYDLNPSNPRSGGFEGRLILEFRL